MLVLHVIQAPKSSEATLRELFERYAGSDSVVDAKELQLILNAAFERGEVYIW